MQALECEIGILFKFVVLNQGGRFVEKLFGIVLAVVAVVVFLLFWGYDQ